MQQPVMSQSDMPLTKHEIVMHKQKNKGGSSMSSISVTYSTPHSDNMSGISSFFHPNASVFYQCGETVDSMCAAQSNALLKEGINWRLSGVEVSLTSGRIIKGAACRRV